jgi:hypothetical protein
MQPNESAVSVAISPEPVDVKEVAQALAAPFEPREIKWKPQAVSGNRALAVAFVDARVIQDRLDEVLGVMGWQDSYECLPDGAVVCRLKIRLGSEWITKMDVGGQSEQPDEGDRRKAAFSDALKRAAVKFGIGRYLYRLPAQWCDYDPQKRQFTRTPTLPPSALPKPSSAVRERGRAPGVAPRADSAAGSANGAPPAQPAEPAERKEPARKRGASAQSAQPAQAGAEAPREGAKGGRGIPANGEELQRRLYEKDQRLAREGACKPGELVKHVVDAGVKAGYERDLTSWGKEAIQLAIEETKAFERAHQPAPPKKEVA